MNDQQLSRMYAKGYRYYVELIGTPNVPPLCVKSSMDVGPLLRRHPGYRCQTKNINQNGTLANA